MKRKPSSLIVHAIAHPLRLGILEVIASGEKTVGFIAKAADIQQSVTSQQLKILADFDVVARRREGTRMYYRLNKPEIRTILKCLRENVGGE